MENDGGTKIETDEGKIEYSVQHVVDNLEDVSIHSGSKFYASTEEERAGKGEGKEGDINLSFTYKKHKLLFIKGVGNNRHNSELFRLLTSQIRTNIYNKASKQELYKLRKETLPSMF